MKGEYNESKWETNKSIDRISIGCARGGGTSVFPGVNVVSAANDIAENGGVIAYDISGQNKDSNIAIGPGAKSFVGGGTQESLLSFGEKVEKKMSTKRIPFLGEITLQTGWHIHDNQGAKENLPASIAIGQNTHARTGAIEVGSHTLEKNDIAIGDTTATKLRQFGVASTTLGTNSYTGGGFATNIGSYNVHSSQYEAKNSSDTLDNATKNSFATIVGTFNSNESMTGSSTSGIANVINGAANKVTNSNGSVVIGAGNTVKGSNASIYKPDSLDLFASVAKMQNALIEGVRKNSGGAALVMGGGNQVDRTTYSQVLGVNNNSTSDKYVLLDGFKNTSSNSKNLSIIGSENTADTVTNTQLLGDKRKLTSVNNSVILGSAEQETELTVSNATILGYNANVKTEGGVALGFGSVLNDSESQLNKSGWDKTGTNGQSSDTSYIWRPTHAAVSVGVSGQSTRRITNVAAGLADTDAVNVAQLKKVAESAGGSGNLIAGDGIKLVKGSDGSWTISTNFTNSGSDNVSYKEVTDTTSTTSTTTTTDGNTTTDNTGISGTNVGTSGTDTAADTTTTQQGKAAVIETTLTADDSNSTTISESGKLGVRGDDSNITTSVSGSDVKVSLHKDISVNSVTVNDGPTINSTGIDMNGKKISNLADGDIYEGSHDAVTGGQLWNVEQGMNNQVRHLDKKINRVGAGAAALAALHPLDFDADDKWNIAAGVGAYKGTSAMALGAFYRPNEVTQLSIGGAFGNGENMWNMGISWRTGSGESYSGKSKAELVRMVNAMEARDAQQDAIIKQQQVDIQKQQEGLAKQEAEINELKAMVQQLLAK